MRLSVTGLDLVSCLHSMLLTYSTCFSPCPPSRVAAAARCRSVWPTWPDRGWWTGRWCTEPCCGNLQTEPPTGSEHWDSPSQNPARNLRHRKWNQTRTYRISTHDQSAEEQFRNKLCAVSVCGLTEDSILGQWAVAHSVRRLVRRQVVHGNTSPFVHVLVMEDVMTVAERRQNSISLQNDCTTQDSVCSFIFSYSQALSIWTGTQLLIISKWHHSGFKWNKMFILKHLEPNYLFWFRQKLQNWENRASQSIL